MIRLSGRVRSALIIGGQGIRARKLRTLLSMISLFLGVLAVVVVQAGGEIADRALLANVELNQGKDGTRLLGLPPDAAFVHTTLDTLRGRHDAVALFGARAIIGEPGVSPINPGGTRFDSPGGPMLAESGGAYLVCDPSGVCRKATDGLPEVQPPGQAIELALHAMTGDVRQFRPFRPVAGRWLDFDSLPSLGPRLVLNREAAKGFAQHRVPAEMRINGASANATPRIIGVVDDGSDQPNAYVRADELLNWLPEAELARDSGIQVMLSPNAGLTERVLRARLVATGLAPSDFQVDTVHAKRQIEDQLALTRWVFLGLAGLVLLIGVAGILNVGLATVGERVEEFALRRAVGTPRSLLAAIVLAETLLTGLLTAAAAIGAGVLALAVGGGWLGARDPSLAHLDFPWQAGVAGVIAGLVAGLLGGLVPALRAARIPIATIMRA
jgi:putative ABC transport system permease protein